MKRSVNARFVNVRRGIQAIQGLLVHMETQVSKVSEDQKETRVMLKKGNLEKEAQGESLGTRVRRVNSENVANQELKVTKDLQGHMDQRVPEDFRALLDLQGIQAQGGFKATRGSLVLLVLMVLQEPLVLVSKVLRGKEARKEEQGLQDRLVLVSQARQVPVVLREHQERGAYQEKDFQDQRVKKVLKDQLAHKDYKAHQSKGTRGIWDL